MYFVGIWKFIKTHNGKQRNWKSEKKPSTGTVYEKFNYCQSNALNLLWLPVSVVF